MIQNNLAEIAIEKMFNIVKKYISSENIVIFSLELILSILALIFLELSVISFGGLMLILGAKYMNVGNIFNSTICYVIADLCWSVNAFNNNDIFGAIAVNLGIIIGLRVLYKMNKGMFVKSLKKQLYI